MLICFESLVLPPYGKLLINRHRPEKAMRSKDILQGTQLKAMRFSADSIVLQTGMDTNYILLRLSVTSTRQRYIFIAAMINLAREQNWIDSAFQVKGMGYAQ